MKKVSTLLAIVILLAGLVTSCKDDSKKDEKKEKTEKRHERPHPENGDQKHPPRRDGDRKGPPPGGRPGGKHDPRQTKTLEEAGGYKIGETATDFELKNVDEKTFSLADVENAKGYIVVFTCNSCPFSKLYEDRLIDLHNEYAPKGYPVIAINPNVNEENEKETFAAMQQRAKEKNFPFVYLADSDHEIFPQYGALRTPHVFLLDKERKVQYIGTIDDNPKSPESATVNYVKDAITALENGSKPDPNFTKAIGCPVKAK